MNKQKYKKGILLAGGKGTRLNPLTLGTSKQLLPIYNKPTIYYPLTTLMLCEIREILLITNINDQENFRKLLGDGSQWGININFATQENANGIAESFLIAEEFIDNNHVALILGDNLFFGQDLSNYLLKESTFSSGATIFAYAVNNPSSYGVVEFDENYKALKIHEKPKSPKSNYAITGLYFFDNKVVNYSKALKPSKRGELEVTDLHKIYLKNQELNIKILGRGAGWFDTGTFDSLYEANSLIHTLEKRQQLRIGYPEEVAWRKGWIDKKKFIKEAEKFSHNEYGQYLMNLIN